MHYFSKFHQSAKNAAKRAICGKASPVNDRYADLCADTVLRLGALGLGSAAAGISLIVAQADTPALAIASFILAGSSILGLASLKRKVLPQFAFLANGAVWLATGGFLASAHPVTGAAIFASLAIASYKADLFKVWAQAGSVEAPIAEAVLPDHVNEPCINTKGEIVHDFTFGNISFGAGEQLAERIHLTDRVSFLRELSELRSGEKSLAELQLRINRSEQDHAAHYEVVIINMRREGAVIALSLAREYHAPKAQKTAQNLQSDLSAQSAFLTIISHELRTPLNAIIGFSDVLRNDIGQNLTQETRDEYTDLIHGAGTHLLALVNTILDVSKLDSGAYTIHRDEFAFGATARDCIAMLSGQAKQKNVKINDRMDGKLDHVNGDRRAIKQILINLLSNAIKYTHDGGFVTVDAHQNAAGLTFEISDTGIGMQAYELEQIGRPFAQLDNSTTRNCEGTGLGLVLVKGLVDLHGGTLTITSKQGIGTRVMVHIPQHNSARNTSWERDGSGQIENLLPRVKLNTLQENDPINDKEISHGKCKVG